MEPLEVVSPTSFSPTQNREPAGTGVPLFQVRAVGGTFTYTNVSQYSNDSHKTKLIELFAGHLLETTQPRVKSCVQV